MGSPRLVLLIGSGELAPSMARAHREVIERLGGSPVPSAFLDTPFAFQENAREIGARAVTYFAERLGCPLVVASTVVPADEDAGEGIWAAPRTPAGPGEERLVRTIGESRYVLAGPGSPSYALARWKSSVLPALLTEKLRGGGAVAFASAAALTVGAYTVPVYEIYKVGGRPRWLAGLDLLSELGMKVAVVPHFDNAEGGTHDTRFCYLGERRLSLMEAQLPDDAFVLGIDEHTTLLLDLDAGSALVGGRGAVTLRRRGRSTRLESGAGIAIAELVACGLSAGATARPRPGGSAVPSSGAPPVGAGAEGGAGASPPRGTAAGAPSGLGHLGEPGAAAGERSVQAIEAAFSAALEDRDAEAAAGNVLALEDRIAAGGGPSDIAASSHELQRARMGLRSMVLELGQLAGAGLADPADLLRPYLDLLVELRSRARAERDYELGDEIRSCLEAVGVEINDTPDGSTWRLRARAAPDGA